MQLRVFINRCQRLKVSFPLGLTPVPITELAAGHPASPLLLRPTSWMALSQWTCGTVGVQYMSSLLRAFHGFSLFLGALAGLHPERLAQPSALGLIVADSPLGCLLFPRSPCSPLRRAPSLLLRKSFPGSPSLCGRFSQGSQQQNFIY